MTNGSMVSDNTRIAIRQWAIEVALQACRENVVSRVGAEVVAVAQAIEAYVTETSEPKAT